MENTNNNQKDMVTDPETPETQEVLEGQEASTPTSEGTVTPPSEEEKSPPEVEAEEAEASEAPEETSGDIASEDKTVEVSETGQDVESETEETSDEQDEQSAEMSANENFEKLVEESFRQPVEGEIINGTIVRVGKEHVMIDIGYKSEGQIPIAEFTDSDGNVTVKTGDKVDVLIERREDENGIIILSKEKADKVKIWEELDAVYQAGTPVDGTIVGKVKGGMTVDIGVRAFLPGSQLDLRPTRNHDAFVGVQGKFEILKFNRRRGNVVVSRRSVLEKERDEKREKTLHLIEKGRIMTGLVKNIVDYGAFIDLGGIDGLLHITDMSWGRIKHPSDMIKVAQELKVVVLKYDEENERVSLGLKQITPDPWDTVAEKFPVGAKVTGKVVSITDYGSFIELEPGVEGLVHVSEMSWTKRVRHPSKIVKPGQEVEVMVLEVNSEERRISLGLKQVEPNPWDVVAQKYPPGSTVKGKIRNITDFGIFIGVEEGIDGLVHISDISWTKRIRHPGELYKKGQEIEATVLNIDQDNERFSLGIKQMNMDPWEDIRDRMRPGDIVTGKVVNATDFGVFLELEEGIEGLIHVSELGLDKSKNPTEVFEPASSLTVEILNIDPNERKIRLSLKAIEEKAEKEEIRQYTSSARSDGTVRMADILGQQLASSLKNSEGEESGTREEAEVKAEPEAVEEEKASDEDTGDKPEEEAAAESSEPEVTEEAAAEPEAVEEEKASDEDTGDEPKEEAAADDDGTGDDAEKNEESETDAESEKPNDEE